MLLPFGKGDRKGWRRLAFIFEVFGAVIINNIYNNLKNKSLDNGWRMCDFCGKRFEIKNKKNTAQIYCSVCSKKIERENKKNRNKIYYNKNKN